MRAVLVFACIALASASSSSVTPTQKVIELLDGIEAGLELPPATTGDVYKGRRAMLPASLRDARAAMMKSKMLRSAFGEGVVRHYARAAEWEIDEFDRIVTDYEVARGFERA